MDDNDETALPGEIKAALAVAVVLLVILGALTLLDMQLKRSMVDTAAQFRQEVERARSGKPRVQPAQADLPGPVRDVHGLGGVGADDAGTQEDGTPVADAPVVRPGDESARPPHRGSVDGP